MDLEYIINKIDENINKEDKYSFSIIIKDINHNDYQFYSSWMFSEEIKFILLDLLNLNIPLYIDIRVYKMLESSDDYGNYNIMYNEHIVLIENTYGVFTNEEIKRFMMEFKLRNGNRFNEDNLFLIPSVQYNVYRRNNLSLRQAKELFLQEDELTDELVEEIARK